MAIPQAEFGTVLFWDQSSGLFRPWAAYGCDVTTFKKIGLSAGESITGKVYEEGRALWLSNPDDVVRAMENMRPGNRSLFTRALGRPCEPLCTIAAPIAMQDQKFGVLVLHTFQDPRCFSSQDVPFVQMLADLIAVAVDRSRLEAKADSIQQASEAELLRSEMMATLSHELRLPLTTIKGYTTLLLMEDVDWSPEKSNETLRLIDEECESMQAMVKSILDSSLLGAKQISVEMQPLRMQYLAREAANEVQQRSAIHRVIVDIAPGFPLVSGDARWIKQVFRNILDNAVKYSPNGGLIVIHGEVRGENVVISIADQGIGIAPEDLIPLFEKYYRVRNTHTRNIPGTGLGLPIARSIIEIHNGRIWADSKPGQGTTLYFSLPILKTFTGALKTMHDLQAEET